MRLAIAAIFAFFSVSLHAQLFTDNFCNGASPLWNNYSGSWTTSGCTYFATIPNNSPSATTEVPFELTDYTVTVTVNSLADGGIWNRSDGTNQNGILLVLGGNGYGQGNRGGNAGKSIYWHIVQNGVASVPQSEVDGVFTPGQTYTITVRVSGNTYSAYINGSSTPVTTLVNSTFASGRVGLYDDQPNTTTGTGSGDPTTFSNLILNAASLLTD